MDAALKAKGTSIPVVTAGNRTYMDPDAIRDYLNELHGIGSWQTFYNCIAPEVYTCDLVVKGVYRTAVVDFNMWPDLKDTAVEKFDFLFSQAAHNFGLRAGHTSAESLVKSDTQVIDVTEEIKAREAAAQVDPPPADSPEPPPTDDPKDPVDDKQGEITEEQADACIAYAIGRDEEHKSRWDEGRIKGMTNQEIKAALTDIFGIEGGSSHPIDHYKKGGKEPKLWVGQIIGKGTPTLKGVELIDRVRKVAGIPTPEEVKTALEAAFARDDTEQPVQPVAQAAGDEDTAPSELASLVQETAEDIGDSVENLGVSAEEPVVVNDEVVPDEGADDTVTVAEPQNGGADPPDYDPANDPFKLGKEAAPAVEETTDEVFAQAAAESAVEAPPAAPPQKMAEVAEFLGKPAPADPGSLDSAICPHCDKVVLPGLAKKCRDAGQVPAHPGCSVRG